MVEMVKMVDIGHRVTPKKCNQSRMLSLPCYRQARLLDSIIFIVYEKAATTKCDSKHDQVQKWCPIIEI